MCELCDNKIRNCRIALEGKSIIRYSQGEYKSIPCFSEIYAPLNFCPACGRKLGE